MNIKQTVKEIIFGLAIVVGVSALATMPLHAATSCDGVKTSIIGCSDKGSVCNDGTAAFEGADPNAGSDPAASQAYFNKYQHEYGKCKDGSAPISNIEQSGVWKLLLMVINILTAGIGILAVAGIVYASILYTSAGGNPEQTKKAMGMITNIVIGIIAYAFMFALLNFITPGGLFN